MRMWSWILLGSAGGAGLIAGILGGVMADRSSRADAAYSDYRKATSLTGGTTHRERMFELDAEVEQFGISMGVFTAVAVGALAGSLYMLFTNPAMAPPGAADGDFAVQPQFGSDGAGLHLGGRF